MLIFQCIDKQKACDLTIDCVGGGDEDVAWCEQQDLLPSCGSEEIRCPGDGIVHLCTILELTLYLFYLFGVLRCFQHCAGHITTDSWKGRGNQYIQFVRVLYCKLLTNGKQLPAFPLEAMQGSNPGLRGGRRESYHSATVAPQLTL